jgi:hypothetical protein
MIAHHAATPAAFCDGSGVPFSHSALVIFRGICVGGRRHGYGPFPVRAARLVPPYVQSNPPLDADMIVPTLYDPEEFAMLYHADKDRALALVAAMSEPQKVRQALTYAAWLAYHGLEIDLATVLAAWEGS